MAFVDQNPAVSAVLNPDRIHADLELLKRARAPEGASSLAAHLEPLERLAEALGRLAGEVRTPEALAQARLALTLRQALARTGAGAAQDASALERAT